MAHFSRLFKVVIDVPAGDYDRELSFTGQANVQPGRGGPTTPEALESTERVYERPVIVSHPVSPKPNVYQVCL